MQEQMICIRFCSSATIESMSNLTDWSEITFERIPTTSTFWKGLLSVLILAFLPRIHQSGQFPSIEGSVPLSY